MHVCVCFCLFVCFPVVDFTSFSMGGMGSMDGMDMGGGTGNFKSVSTSTRIVNGKRTTTRKYVSTRSDDQCVRVRVRVCVFVHVRVCVFVHFFGVTSDCVCVCLCEYICPYIILY